MSDHLVLDKSLHEAGFEERVRGTFLGQAHFAGSGPSGTSCRECEHWGVKLYPRDAEPHVASPGYYSRSHETPCALKRATCNYPINNKSSRRFPHSAPSCCFFSANPTPPAITMPEEPKKGKKAA